MKTKPHVFETFPKFSKLTLADRDKYQSLVKEHPPISDLTFVALMTWWNPLNNISISQLNDNLVIPYWIPGAESHSGLSLVGTNNVDESICTIFDYLRERGEPVRLVNVPESVISNVKYHEMFNFSPQRRYDEYIVSIARFYPLKNMKTFWRRRVEKLIVKMGEERLVTKSLDLRIAKNRQLLIDATEKWQHKGINDYGKHETEAIKECVAHAEELGIDNVCLFVDGRLYGYCFYEIPANDRRYMILKHIKATQQSTLGFELIGYTFAKWFAEQGVIYANLSSDFGQLRLRMFMLTLGPTNFFRKYTIKPSS